MKSGQRDAIHAARLQLSLWLERTVRIAAGIHHDRTPIVRLGQWVRFVGDPSVVQTNGPLRRWAYGQVLYRWRGGGLITVIFLGSKTFANLRAADVEPLVGTPIGRPRDHLRRFKRLQKARQRTIEAIELQVDR